MLIVVFCFQRTFFLKLVPCTVRLFVYFSRPISVIAGIINVRRMPKTEIFYGFKVGIFILYIKIIKGEEWRKENRTPQQTQVALKCGGGRGRGGERAPFLGWGGAPNKLKFRTRKRVSIGSTTTCISHSSWLRGALGLCAAPALASGLGIEPLSVQAAFLLLRAAFELLLRHRVADAEVHADAAVMQEEFPRPLESPLRKFMERLARLREEDRRGREEIERRRPEWDQRR